MSNPKLIHMRSAVIGAQLVSLALRGNTMPADTAENMIANQLANHQLVRTDVDLSQCGQSAAMRDDVRRMYALKILELLMLRQDRHGLGMPEPDEQTIRKAWTLTQIMMEEDQTSSQLGALAAQPKAT